MRRTRARCSLSALLSALRSTSCLKITFAVGDKQIEVQKKDLGFVEVGDGMQYGGIQSRGDSKFDILGGT